MVDENDTYTSLPGFENVYLEDSWVLDIEAHPARLTFKLEVVLTPEHPLYAPPRPDEQYCYRASTITFANVRALTWTDQGQPPAVDASGEADFGHIDSFIVAAGHCRLEGDWGQIKVESDPPALDLI
jgi:hypothetical protein